MYKQCIRSGKGKLFIQKIGEREGGSEGRDPPSLMSFGEIARNKGMHWKKGNF